MRTFVFLCGALLVLASAYALFSYPLNLFELFRSQPAPQLIAWAFIIVVSLILLATAIWLNEKLLQQRTINETLESRLHVEAAQKDVDRAADHLTRTDPDPAIQSLQQRLSNAEQKVRIQQQRNEANELQARTEEIRTRQQSLREKLGEAIERRRSIQQLFAEYEDTQHNIERVLSDIEEDKTGETLEARIGKLSQFTKVTDSRFEELDRSKQMLLNLREEFDTLQNRLLPLRDDQCGIKALILQLNNASAQLGTTIDAINRDGDTIISERIKRITENKRELSERISSLVEEFSKLDHSHKDITALFSRLSNELKARYNAGVSDVA